MSTVTQPASGIHSTTSAPLVNRPSGATRVSDEREATVDTDAARPGILVMRGFLGVFWLLEFLGKTYDAKADGLSVQNLLRWSDRLTLGFTETTPLPPWLVRPYTLIEPFAELAVGLLVLIGLKTRAALIAAAALLVSLDVGLLFQREYELVKLNAVILLTLMVALQWERWNRFSVDAWLAHRR